MRTNLQALAGQLSYTECMSKPLLILVTGLSASGKTTLARDLSARLHIPCICKDDLKEILFDTLGWHDREWSKKLGAATFPLMHHLVEEQLRHGRSLILEGNFNPKYDNQRFSDLQKRYDAVVIQLVCQADGKVLLERFAARAATGRHLGHRDHDNIDEFREFLLHGKSLALDVASEIIRIDTTDVAQVDNAALARRIAKSIAHTDSK